MAVCCVFCFSDGEVTNTSSSLAVWPVHTFEQQLSCFSFQWREHLSAGLKLLPGFYHICCPLVSLAIPRAFGSLLMSQGLQKASHSSLVLCEVLYVALTFLRILHLCLFSESSMEFSYFPWLSEHALNHSFIDHSSQWSWTLQRSSAQTAASNPLTCHKVPMLQLNLHTEILG